MDTEQSKKQNAWRWYGVGGAVIGVVVLGGLYMVLWSKDTSVDPISLDMPQGEDVLPSGSSGSGPRVPPGGARMPSAPKTPDSVWARAMESPNPSSPSVGLYVVPQELVDAVGGEYYNGFITAAGDPAKSFEWKILSGALPHGLSSAHSLDCANVLERVCKPSFQISGTPEAAGSYSFRIAVSDGTKAVYKDMTLLVHPAPNLAITTASLPQAVLGENYTAALTGSGGFGAYSWSIKSGALPPGLSIGAAACLNAGTCRAPATITGRPGQMGAFTFGVVLSSGERTITKEFTIVVGK